MQSTLENNRILRSDVDSKSKVFGEKIGLIARLFGCWHKNMSRPFPEAGETYVSCLNCGARRHFDPESLITIGTFHYPPEINHGS